MIEREHSFPSADDLTIRYREWLPDAGTPRATILILHGLSEHSGRYRHVAEALTAVGFACFGIDQRGHGQSGGARAYIPEGRLAVDDLCGLYEIVRSNNPEQPIFAFCHSMGSLIGLGFALRYPGRLRGLATSGTPLHGEFSRPAWLVSLCLKAARYVPKLRLSPPGGPGALTSDKQMLREWWADPLIDKGMWRVGTSAAMVRLARDICRSADQLQVPLLVMHGAGDRLVPPSGSEYLASAAGSPDVTLQIYAELRHELVNETCRDEVIRFLRDWLLERA